MLQVERDAGEEPREQHQDEQHQRQSELHHHVETRDHVERVHHDAVGDAVDVHEDLDVLPEREVPGVQDAA